MLIFIIKKFLVKPGPDTTADSTSYLSVPGYCVAFSSQHIYFINAHKTICMHNCKFNIKRKVQYSVEKG